MIILIYKTQPQQERLSAYNETSRRDHETTVAVEKQ